MSAVIKTSKKSFSEAYHKFVMDLDGFIKKERSELRQIDDLSDKAIECIQTTTLKVFGEDADKAEKDFFNEMSRLKRIKISKKKK